MPEIGFCVGGKHIEAAWCGPAPERAPTLVLLHEGLGCVATWKTFPQRLAERTGCGVLAYSRPGYGRSDPTPLPWRPSYMHDEALNVLPAVLDQAKVRKAVLIGHSDGASIAAILAGSRQDSRIRGLVLMAPHFFVEDMGLRAIAAAKTAYETGPLRARLARYHQHVDVAFRGWNGAWLDPAFRAWRIDNCLAHIRVPILIIQGESDEYGTIAQIRLAEDEAYCPVEVAMLPDCRHSPYLDQPDATLAAVAEFVHRLLAVHEGLMPA
ncbi:MAG TPA: alpha/beta hydrolase [Xanthobacteraceae bacterium]|nr:alpha/beta hydrolase [Xanthobacteraceae bacterium]